MSYNMSANMNKKTHLTIAEILRDLRAAAQNEDDDISWIDSLPRLPAPPKGTRKTVVLTAAPGGNQDKRNPNNAKSRPS